MRLVTLAAIVAVGILPACAERPDQVTVPAAPTTSGTVSPVEPPPSPVRAKTHAALTGNTVQRLDEPIEWVKTTADQWGALQLDGKTSPPGGYELYVVQVHGAFICRSCKGAATITGSTIVLELPLKVNQQVGEGFIMGNTSYDLNRIGTVHTFEGT